MGKGGQTIGYHYMFDILFGLSRGPLNELRAIMVADKIAWEGPECDGDVKAIKKPDLFGGEQKEGGIQGPFRVFFGDRDQILPGAGSANCGSSGPLKGSRTLPGVKSAIGGRVSEMRGTTMLWFSGLVCSLNPYPKEWSFRVRRQTAGWHDDNCWYPAKAAIYMNEGKIHAMNPAHIIYQCLTDPAWGRGLPRSKIDHNSFIRAANTLCSEGFGLCFIWQRKGQDVDQFIQMVQEHIACALYADPETGKMTIRLIRQDYDVDDLPVFAPASGLLDIKEDDSTSQDEIFNELVGKGKDPITNEEFQVRVHNLAARVSSGAPNAQEKQYPGIPTKELMIRVLSRDLRETASGLKKFTVVLDRRGWKIRPGMPFVIQDTRRGLANIVLRAAEIEDKSFKDGRITIKAMQDVWGLPATGWVTPVESTWSAPTQDAIPATTARLVEANYRDVVLQASDSTLATLDATDAFIGALALSPNGSMYEYRLPTRAAGEPEFQDGDRGGFTGAATLLNPVGPYDTVLTLTGETDIADDLVGQAVLVGDEQMGVTAYDPDSHLLTVTRGVADTVPQSHAAATTLWTIDDDLVSDFRTYASGETVEAYVLTATYSDVLDPSEADLLTVDVVGRQGRPYPPGNVMADTIRALDLPQTAHAEPALTWSHRDRILQDDQLVGHIEGSVGPEAGVTYNIRVYDAAAPGVVLRSVAGLTGESWTYDAAMQTADGNPIAVYFELESVRDGLVSFQNYRFRVAIQSGYGIGYGFNYGGL